MIVQSHFIVDTTYWLHLATSWNWARVMLGPLNLFTISRICRWEEWSKMSKNKERRQEMTRLSIERVLSVASDSVCHPFLWHQPGLVHMVPVDLLRHQLWTKNQTQECHLNVCHASGECHLISWSEPSQGEQSRKIGGSFESSWYKFYQWQSDTQAVCLENCRFSNEQLWPDTGGTLCRGAPVLRCGSESRQ